MHEQERLAGMGAERHQVLTIKAEKEIEVNRLKKVEATLVQRAKHEQELARQLADSRASAKRPPPLPPRVPRLVLTLLPPSHSLLTSLHMSPFSTSPSSTPSMSPL